MTLRWCHTRGQPWLSHILKMYSKAMNGQATVQCGLVLSIYFSRKGDTAVTTVKSVHRYLGFGEDSHPKQWLNDVVFVDRGYNVASVIRLFFGYVVKFFELTLRTLASGLFAPAEILNIGRLMFQLNGHSLFSTRKINNVEYLALCYRVLDVSLERKSRERIAILPPATLRNNFTALGY
jgi:hypothetical protein